MDVLFPPLVEAVFVRRVNRFLAEVLVEGRQVAVHVPNSGRMKELFLPGAKVWLNSSSRLDRKTAYTLKLVEKDGHLVVVDSILANDLVEEGLRQGKIPALQGVWTWQREIRQGLSRFDFCLEQDREKIWLEVKSVNLVENNIAMFPDAPTSRGARHVRELLDLVKDGQRALIIFVVMRDDAVVFQPHWEQDPDFALALQEAAAGGVEVYAFASEIKPAGASLGPALPVELG